MKLTYPEYNRLIENVAEYCDLILPLAKGYLSLDDLKITSRLVNSMAPADIAEAGTRIIKVDFITAVKTYSYTVGVIRYDYDTVNEFECSPNIYHNILRGLYRTKYEIDQNADPSPKLYPMEK